MDHKIIKFIKFWWKYNFDKTENISPLFVIIFILLSPLYLLYLIIEDTKQRFHEYILRRKKFFEDWRSFNGK